MIDDLLRGLLGTSMETMDQFITQEVTNHLFETKSKPFSGMDLAALNIQRARDHGIRPYNDYRALCNLKRARTWEDLSREITPEIITRLKQTYEHVDDIDLFPGGLAETSLHGGLVGPTFACIIAMQFRQLRKCDRFWWDPFNRRHFVIQIFIFGWVIVGTRMAIRWSVSPKPNWLRSVNPLHPNWFVIIRTESILLKDQPSIKASHFCKKSIVLFNNSSTNIQIVCFFFRNPRVPCRSLPSIDLELWKERVSCTVGSTNIEVGKADRISPCVMCTCTREGVTISQNEEKNNCSTNMELVFFSQFASLWRWLIVSNWRKRSALPLYWTITSARSSALSLSEPSRKWRRPPIPINLASVKLKELVFAEQNVDRIKQKKNRTIRKGRKKITTLWEWMVELKRLWFDGYNTSLINMVATISKRISVNNVIIGNLETLDVCINSFCQLWSVLLYCVNYTSVIWIINRNRLYEKNYKCFSILPKHWWWRSSCFYIFPGLILFIRSIWSRRRWDPWRKTLKITSDFGCYLCLLREF